jgi:hypothetical protein
MFGLLGEPLERPVVRLQPDNKCAVCNRLEIDTDFDMRSLLNSSFRCSVCAVIKAMLFSVYPDATTRGKIGRISVWPFPVVTIVEFVDQRFERYSMYIASTHKGLILQAKSLARYH